MLIKIDPKNWKDWVGKEVFISEYVSRKLRWWDEQGWWVEHKSNFNLSFLAETVWISEPDPNKLRKFDPVMVLCEDDQNYKLAIFKYLCENNAIITFDEYWWDKWRLPTKDELLEHISEDHADEILARWNK